MKPKEKGMMSSIGFLRERGSVEKGDAPERFTFGSMECPFRYKGFNAIAYI